MNGKIVLGALGGIGLITTVSVVSSRSGSSDPSWTKEMPPFRFLSVDATFMDPDLDNFSSRFGYRYAGLLVSNIKYNDNWWKWSYENLEKDSKNKGTISADAFKVVRTPPEIPNSETSLKSWCSEIYKADVGSKNPSYDHDSIFNNVNIWKYCSPVQQSPVSLEKSGVTYSAGTIGNIQATALLDTNKNERIWYYKNKFFDEIKEHAFTEDNGPLPFISGVKRGKKLKDICAEAYKQKIEEALIREVMFFCSIN